MRKYAEANGCGYIEIPIREIPGGGMISKRVYVPVRPLPCVRDERGEIKEQAVKQLFAKINEELDELKGAIFPNYDETVETINIALDLDRGNCGGIGCLVRSSVSLSGILLESFKPGDSSRFYI